MRGDTGVVPIHHRRLLSSVSVVAVSVLAVVLVLVAPRWLAGRASQGPVPPGVPEPTREAQTVGTRDWHALECPGHAVGCRVPTLLNLGGARFLHRHGHRQAVLRRDPSTRTLVRTVSPASGRRWILVGADGASSASELSIKLGDAPSASIPPGSLTMLSIPGRSHPVRVTVADYGRAGGREVLQIEEYDALH